MMEEDNKEIKDATICERRCDHAFDWLLKDATLVLKLPIESLPC